METLHIDWLATSQESTGTEPPFEVGAHLVSEREGYTHHGIYAGHGQVIHYGGFHHSTMRRPIEYVSLNGFAAGSDIKVQTEPDVIYTGRDAVERAKSRLGEDRYRLLTNNCEHFCAWCVRGVGRSEQVRRGLRNPWAGVKMLFALARATRSFRDRANRKLLNIHRLPLMEAAHLRST